MLVPLSGKSSHTQGSKITKYNKAFCHLGKGWSTDTEVSVLQGSSYKPFRVFLSSNSPLPIKIFICLQWAMSITSEIRDTLGCWGFQWFSMHNLKLLLVLNGYTLVEMLSRPSQVWARVWFDFKLFWEICFSVSWLLCSGTSVVVIIITLFSSWSD